MSRLLIAILESCLRLFNCLPLRVRYGIGETLTGIWFLCARRSLRVARKNLAIVFPAQDEKQHELILRGSIASLGHLIVDALRAPWLSEEWIRQHVEVPNLNVVTQALEEYPNTGILFVSPHLGSFELVPHALPLFGVRLNLIYRRFRPAFIDSWFSAIRSRRGCTAIDRTNAVPKMIKLLRSGQHISILGDQNVRADQAVFVPQFGKLAACARSIGLVALRVDCPVIVGCIQDAGFDRYRIVFERCAVEMIRKDQSLSLDQKVAAITAVVMQGLERLILMQPERWFWFHRRWRTRPEGETERVYD